MPGFRRHGFRAAAALLIAVTGTIGSPQIAHSGLTPRMVYEGTISDFSARSVVIDGQRGRYEIDRRAWPRKIAPTPGRKVKLMLPSSSVRFLGRKTPERRAPEVDWATGKIIRK